MNSLELLRWAAWEALKWLENEYWSFEDDLTPVTWMNDFVSNVHLLLDQYCDQLEKLMKRNHIGSWKNSYTRIISQIDFLQTLPRIMRNPFVSALCDYKRECEM